MRKREWPGHIADALGIPTVYGSDGPWISNGDTTDVSWFLALCSDFSIPYPGERIRAMEAIVQVAGGTWDQAVMSSAGEGKKPGGNVRREAFEALWTVLDATGGLPGSVTDPTEYANATFPGSKQSLPSLDRVLRSIALRRGQPAFRKKLIAAYESTCAVTGAQLDSVLEAAHIRPHARGGTMATSNGLLLRADMHTLFDLRHVAIDTTTWTVLAHPSVRASAGYGDLHGRPLALPKVQSDCPSAAALDAHRSESGL